MVLDTCSLLLFGTATAQLIVSSFGSSAGNIYCSSYPEFDLSLQWST